nr:hypothetical protein [Tanacetum cinerariifolium]
QFEHNSPLEMVIELQKMYGKPPGVELQELMNMFHLCKQAEGQSVSDHVLLMKSYLDQLATLNYAFRDKVFISFILNSLSSEFQSFVQNYNMQSMEKTISEVHSLLIEFEKSIKRNKQPIVGASSTQQVMAIQGGRVQKYKPQGKAKGKGKGKGSQKSYPTKPKSLNLTRKSIRQKMDNVTTAKRNDIGKGIVLHVSKKGASYFITFTDDYSRYGYVYLLKHKHEVFETWKKYALESTAHILNMVPTKKVDRTLYELWHGKVPNLSYLKIDPDRLCFNVEVEEHSLGNLNKPANYKATLSDPKFEKWLVNMNAEMQSVYDNKVWGLVVLPPNAKVVKSKWIYKKKTNMDGKVHIYKAQLVAKVYTQTYGVDYEETFTPVADIRAIRIVIAIAAYYDYEIWQMDIKIVFLNGFLEKEIYMEQLEGFIDPNHPRKVCKLQRSIYSLKQASRSWNKIFDEEIKKFGFHQNLDEPCVYQKASGSNVIFLILYVDDIILMGNHIPSLQEVKTYLGKCFSMKDLGEAAFILGIKIYRDRSRWLIRLSQNEYLDKILKRYRMDNSKHDSIPMQVDLHLSKSQCATTSAEIKHMHNVPYASAVGSIMYAVRNTKDAFLVYGGDPEAELRVNCYCDAGFETDRDDTKSETGKFIDELGVVPSNEYPIKMNCDNSVAVIMAKELGIQKGARHFKRKYHYVHECIKTGEIDIVKVHTDDNLADPFMKALAGPKPTRHARIMGLCPASSFM